MRLVVVTGPDGSGKTSTCQRVVQTLTSQWGPGSVIQVSVWNALMQSDLFPSKEKVVEYLNDLDGFTRTLFIYHALNRAVDLAKRSHPHLILIEGYWYKYAVTEIGQGVDSSAVIAAAHGFHKPDLTLCLDVDPETAWLRKQEVSQYEQGIQTQGSNRDRFIQFQTHLEGIWKELEGEYGPWVHLSTSHSAEEVANQMTSILMEKSRGNES